MFESDNSSAWSSLRAGLRERQDPSQKADRLRDELGQCKKKLRKWVEHSECFEKDRKGVLDAISSCKDLPKGVVGSSVGEMVSSFCDRLVSVEEECDELASSEQKAVEYLAKLDSLGEKYAELKSRLAKLDSLREKYAELESRVRDRVEDDSKISSSLAECKSKLKKARKRMQVSRRIRSRSRP